jgi:predicted nucleic acid-binding protein
VILDADVLIDLYRRRPTAHAWFASRPELPLLAGFAANELMEGAANLHKMRDVRRFLLPFTLCWPTEAAMIRAHTSYQPLRLAHGIKFVDYLIAPTATGRGEDLATFNVKHFRAVPGLVTVQPYIR